MISHEYRCIFVHIPKCGGTSIEDAIWSGPRSEDDLWKGAHVEDGLRQSLHHLYARQIQEKVGEPIFSSYFKFAFVRNPWDWAVSQYVYIRSDWPWRSARRTWQFATFKNFLRTVERVRDTRWEPQHSYLYDKSGTLLVDHVARFEAIGEEYKFICRKIGLEGIDLPHKKKSIRKDYREYYTPTTRDAVARLYRKDIETFGYSF
jgi:hypothetical protein